MHFALILYIFLAFAEEDYVSSCDNQIDTTVHSEYIPYLGKYVAFWGAYGYCGYCQAQLRTASEWWKLLEPNLQSQIHLIWVNGATHSSHYQTLADVGDGLEGVSVVQESGDEWSWSSYDLSLHYVTIYDQQGRQMDSIASFGDRQSRWEADDADPKISILSAIDHGSPCGGDDLQTTSTAVVETTQPTLSPSFTEIWETCEFVSFVCDSDFDGTYPYTSDIDGTKTFTSDSGSYISYSNRLFSIFNEQHSLIPTSGEEGIWNLYARDTMSLLRAYNCGQQPQCVETMPSVPPASSPSKAPSITPSLSPNSSSTSRSPLEVDSPSNTPNMRPTDTPSTTSAPTDSRPTSSSSNDQCSAEIVELQDDIEAQDETLLRIEDTQSELLDMMQEIKEITLTNERVRELDSHARPEWYDTLRSCASGVTLLDNSHFQSGTYRIQTSGCYRLLEDIEFNPTPTFPVNNPQYPMSKYYLGFFAAITIEVGHVLLDLGGFTIQQSEEFYKWQRFWNAIELNDRLFVPFEGMFSLSYQSNDPGPYDQFLHRDPAIAHHVIISDGSLGRSSHNGIHGNGNSDIVIENVHVHSFEVAGIQLNGGDRLIIDNTEVGPNAHSVPYLASWSSAISTDRFTNVYIPHFLSEYGLSSLLETPFQDSTIGEIFERLHSVVNGFATDPENADESATQLFNNTLRIPDGSAVYGIFLHRYGAGVEDFAAQDENYFGPEHFDISLSNVNVHDLKSSPRNIPTLTFNDGSILQGPARASVDIASLLKGKELFGILESSYQPNFLHDAWLAMWRLSTLFYEDHILSSPCGNFASNLTSNYADCQGVFQNSLTGREIVLIQKKMFGGLKLSKQFYDWALDPNGRLGKLFVSDPDITSRRQSHHRITCGADAMFHINKGIVGLRLEFLGNVTLNDVTVENIENVGDAGHWLCDRKFQLFDNREVVQPMNLASGRQKGPDVRGITFGKSEGIFVNDVTVDNLRSLEGAAIGVDVVVDASDRSDYEGGEFEFEKVDVGTLHAGRGDLAFPYRSKQIASRTSTGMSAGEAPDFQYGFDNAKLHIIFENKGTDDCHGSLENARACLEHFDVDDQFMLAMRKNFQQFLRQNFGLELALNQTHWWDAPSSDLWDYSHTNQEGHVKLICDKSSCKLPRGNALVTETYIALVVKEAFTVHGTYGGVPGKSVYPGEFLIIGGYNVHGVARDSLRMTYAAECPLSVTENFLPGSSSPSRLAYMINCAMNSPELGIGLSVGLLGAFCSRTNPDFFETFVATISFDDYGSELLDPAEGDPIDDGSVLMYQTISHGPLRVSLPKAGFQSHPLTNAFHLRNEAGVAFFKNWLNWEDSRIQYFRHEALQFFKQVMEINSINADVFWFDDLGNTLDLGGGNKVEPYIVTEAAQHKLVGMKELMEPSFIPNVRIHEGGFRFVAGRAGIQTFTGFIPFGSIILFGYYVFEFPTGRVEISYADEYPQIPNSNNHFVIQQHVTHKDHGVGVCQGLGLVTETSDHFQANVHMNFMWG